MSAAAVPGGVEFDIAVLGAGAAGLLAAARAAQRGRSVVLLEKNRRVGVKILMSGGSRCNLTNARGLRRLDLVSGPIDPAYDPREARGARAIMSAFGPRGTFLGPALKAFSVEDSVGMFESEGVATKVEANGKVFPASDSAVDVQEALARRALRAGVELRVSCPAAEILRSKEGFEVRTASGPLLCRRVILATGGASYPGCGTTGDGYAWAAALGHTIVPPRPALVPLRVGAGWLHQLSGVSLPEATVSVLDAAGRLLASRREALLLTHQGLSGPAVLDVSREVGRSDDPRALQLELDLVPATSRERLDADVASRSREGRPAIAALLPLPRRLGEAIVHQAGIPAGRVGPELSRGERQRLLEAVKALRLPIEGTLGLAKAEVTSGGVALEEVDPATLQSRACPGLFLCGEILDLDGLIGGYNFQAAWSTGYLAGSQV